MSVPDHTGETLDGRYHVGALIGRGGMGRVYVGHHTRLDRKVAIKVLNADLALEEKMVKRFFREARAAAAIGHRNIIDVLDVGVSQAGDPYLVMEYLEGGSLADLLERTPAIDLAAACGIVEQVLLGLAAAHKAGIVHRDLKPENILVTHPEGESPLIKLIDFGISKVTEEAQTNRLTETGQLLGTPAYMAPEQAADAIEVDERADIYAVGVILYELLTGVLPFDASSHYQLLAQVLRGKPMPPQEANPGFPEEAEPLVMKAMAHQPADRYQSATDLLGHLRKLSPFGQRGAKLEQLACGVFETTMAQGALGEHASGGEPKEADPHAVLAELVGQSTPGRMEGRRTAPAGLARFKGVALALVAALAVGAWLALRGTDGESQGAPAATPTSSGSVDPSGTGDVVQITVRGAPEGATIFYDSAPVSDNPFRARKGSAVVPLRVEAPGHVARAISVTPSQDRTLDVALELQTDSRPPAPAPRHPPASPPILLPTTTATEAKPPKGFRPEFE